MFTKGMWLRLCALYNLNILQKFMEHINIQTEEQKTLHELASRTIESIKRLPQSVVVFVAPLQQAVLIMKKTRGG